MNILDDASGQNVGRRDGAAERTSWSFANSSHVINAAGRTRGDFVFAIEPYDGRQVVWKIEAGAVSQMIFQCELICGGINLSKVVDVGVGWASSRTTDTVRYCNRDKDSNDENQKKDFRNRKCRTGGFILFTHTTE